MNSFDTKKVKDFEEFEALKEELEAAETRPYAPDPSPQFKLELRQQLLQQHERRGLSRLEMGRLWRFAGTAVSLLLLLLAALYFWAVLSNPATTTGSGQDTIIVLTQTAVPDNTPVPMSATYAESDVVSWSNRPANVRFGDSIQLEQFAIEELKDGLALTLYWQPQAKWPESIQLFVHLQNEDGQLVWQSEFAPTKSQQDTILVTPMAVQETQLPDGRYDIIIGLYNPTTGERMPAAADNERMVVDDGTAVWLTDWEFNFDSPLCGSGFYDDKALAVELIPCAQIGNDDFIMLFVQKARPSAASPVEFEVTVGYELSATQEVYLKLLYALPEWETYAGDGRPPIDGMGDWAALNPDTNSITLNFIGNPSEMTQIVGTEQPVLVVQIGYFVGEGDGRRLEILASQTFADIPLDLTNPEEIRLNVEP